MGAPPDAAVDGGAEEVAVPAKGSADGVGAVTVGEVGAVTDGEALLAGVDSRAADAPGPKPREPARAITVTAAAPPMASTRCGAGVEL